MKQYLLAVHTVEGEDPSPEEMEQAYNARPAARSLAHATRADLLRRLGSHEEAAEAYEAALALAGNAAERRFLQARRASLPNPDDLAGGRAEEAGELLLSTLG